MAKIRCQICNSFTKKGKFYRYGIRMPENMEVSKSPNPRTRMPSYLRKGKGKSYICNQCVLRAIKAKEQKAIMMVAFPIVFFIAIGMAFVFKPEVIGAYLIVPIIPLALILVYGLVNFFESNKEIGSKLAVRINKKKYKHLKLIPLKM